MPPSVAGCSSSAGSGPTGTHTSWLEPWPVVSRRPERRGLGALGGGRLQAGGVQRHDRLARHVQRDDPGRDRAVAAHLGRVGHRVAPRCRGWPSPRRVVRSKIFTWSALRTTITDSSRGRTIWRTAGRAGVDAGRGDGRCPLPVPLQELGQVPGRDVAVIGHAGQQAAGVRVPGQAGDQPRRVPGEAIRAPERRSVATISRVPSDEKATDAGQPDWVRCGATVRATGGASRSALPLTWFGSASSIPAAIRYLPSMGWVHSYASRLQPHLPVGQEVDRGSSVPDLVEDHLARAGPGARAGRRAQPGR